ncbi:MAG TPA: glutathione S-transferase [Stenomitos sp.]
MKVYEYKAFPNPWRVRLAIAEKGLTDQVEFVQVDLPQGEHKQVPFLAKNPAGSVPLLELDDGTYIAECTAITEYFDHLTGEPTLTGKGAFERAMIHMMQRRVETNLLDAISHFFHHATPGLGFESYQIQEWGERQRAQAITTLNDLDQLLATRPYIAGDRFTVADITALAGLAFGGFCQIMIPETATHLKAWHARMQQRPSFSA